MNLNSSVSVMNKPIRLVVRALIVASISIVLCELVSGLYFHMFRHRFTFFDPAAFAINSQQLESARKFYDPDLGWVRNYPTPLGERTRARTFDYPLISVFGDAFAYGYAGLDDQPWEESLAGRLKHDALNFGVAA